MNFWETLWSIILMFFFLAYLVLLFHIVSDLFRDSSLSGWAKAIWIVLLLIFPLATALAYVIIRGSGMALRTEARERAVVKDTEDYIREVAGTQTPAQQIAVAKNLLDTGAINAAEYDRLKARALQEQGGVLPPQGMAVGAQPPSSSGAAPAPTSAQPASQWSGQQMPGAPA